jgi:hypothetical protein
MWKKIDTQLVYSNMIENNVITDNPNDPKDQYEIKSIHNGYVMALHCNGQTAIKFFPRKDLLDGSWWVKDEK